MRTKVKRFLFPAMFLILGTGIAGAQPPGVKPARNDSTISGQWYLIPALPSDTVTGRLPKILFNLKMHSFSGNTGCNSMRGTFMLSDSSISFSEDLITTKMACVGYDEPAFLKNLLRITGFRIVKSVLILYADGAEVSRWSRRILRPKRTATARAEFVHGAHVAGG